MISEPEKIGLEKLVMDTSLTLTARQIVLRGTSNDYDSYCEYNNIISYYLLIDDFKIKNFYSNFRDKSFQIKGVRYAVNYVFRFKVNISISDYSLIS